jgi:hypothetical protein
LFISVIELVSNLSFPKTTHSTESGKESDTIILLSSCENDSIVDTRLITWLRLSSIELFCTVEHKNPEDIAKKERIRDEIMTISSNVTGNPKTA